MPLDRLKTVSLLWGFLAVATFPLKFISTIKYQDALIAASPGTIHPRYLPNFCRSMRMMGRWTKWTRFLWKRGIQTGWSI